MPSSSDSERLSAPALAGADAGDHDLLGAGELDLEPGLAARAAAIGRCGILDDDPLEVELLAGRECAVHIVEHRRHHQGSGDRGGELLEDGPSLAERKRR